MSSFRSLSLSTACLLSLAVPLGPVACTDAAGEGLDDEGDTQADDGDSGEAGNDDGMDDGMDDGDDGNDGDEPPPPPAYEEWVKIELEGTTCSDGSQYKFFVNWREGAEDLMVIFEPGGACWDYASCSGELGKLGAANPNGIPDDHMTLWELHSPLMQRIPSINPMSDWNMVFVPYCTGDVHSGSQVMNYVSESGDQELEYRHVGHDNMMIVSEWLGWQFGGSRRMYAGGCSAGGVGSNVNYFFLREAIAPERGYLVNDSGPLFPNSVDSAPLYAEIEQSWGLQTVIDSTPVAAALDQDFGALNGELAELFPEDRLGVTYFVRDFNYSRYSYERFYEGIDKDGIHERFLTDTLLLIDEYDQYDNLAYHIPYFRDINDSHCTTIIDFALTEVGETDVGDFIIEVLDDDAPLVSRADLEGNMAGG